MSDLATTVVTLPSMTAVLPSRKAMRERPSQFLNESTTSGCCGTKTTSAISFDLSEWGLSIFLPPVSLPTLKLNLVARQADRRVASLDLAGDVEGLDLRGELADLVERLVLLVDHDVADAGHVLLHEALNVQADVVAGLGGLVTGVVHLDGEDLALARVGG